MCSKHQHNLNAGIAGWQPAPTSTQPPACTGFDVWLGNVRGNHYSRSHTVLDTADAAYWAFSWEEMADKDLPAMIRYELNVTGVPVLSYVGFSQGTTMAFAALSSNSWLHSVIHTAVLLAPVAFATNVASPALREVAKQNTDKVSTARKCAGLIPVPF